MFLWLRSENAFSTTKLFLENFFLCDSSFTAMAPPFLYFILLGRTAASPAGTPQYACSAHRATASTGEESPSSRADWAAQPHRLWSWRNVLWKHLHRLLVLTKQLSFPLKACLWKAGTKAKKKVRLQMCFAESHKLAGRPFLRLSTEGEQGECRCLPWLCPALPGLLIAWQGSISHFVPDGAPETHRWPVQVGTPAPIPRHRWRESLSAFRASWATRLASASTST